MTSKTRAGGRVIRRVLTWAAPWRSLGGRDDAGHDQMIIGVHNSLPPVFSTGDRQRALYLPDGASNL